LLPAGVVSIDAKTKAILIGSDVAVDGFGKRRVRIITHAHADHVLGLNDSIAFSNYIVATPATHDLVVELGYIQKSSMQTYMRKRVAVNYHEKREFYGHEVEFLPATHILGSAQIRVVYDNVVVGYTGDFKMGGGTEVIEEPDILVIEATYGSPLCRRPFKNEVVDLAVDLVSDGIRKYSRVVIYGYYGKLQEMMKILRERGIREPFLMNNKIYSITKIAEKYGWIIGSYYLVDSEIGREVMGSERYILFDHMSKAKYRKLDGRALNIVLTGHEFSEPVKKIDEYTWIVSFSDHADFDELVEYVELSKPKLVVVDGSREGYPHVFAKELKKRGWNAIVLPQ